MLNASFLRRYITFRSFFLSPEVFHAEGRFPFQTSMFFCRCRIPECDGTEASFQPDWLRNAVPFRQHDARSVPWRCRRFAPRNSSLLSENAERNDSSCSPQNFDNSSVIRCDAWVYDGEETTILREVGCAVKHLCWPTCRFVGACMSLLTTCHYGG
jgi:hypothetical protein